MVAASGGWLGEFSEFRVLGMARIGHKGEETSSAPQAHCGSVDGHVVVDLNGNWIRGSGTPVISGDWGAWPDRFDATNLGDYDSTLPGFLLAKLREEGVENVHFEGLPENLRGLMELALEVPERGEAKRSEENSGGLKMLGKRSRSLWTSVVSVLEFIGETVRATAAFLFGRAKFRKEDFHLAVQECGINALPIVSLISFLIGMILAFVGNVQLESFGASLYVADLVGIAMVREMGVVMTAIIMSGRTGAAFAAHIGSMNANQEIDALRTFGFQPFHYLVLPRVFALVLMMPLLTIYANAVGILGGMLVAAGVGIPPALFWAELLTVVDITQSSLGVFKSVFFGAAIAIAGCYHGMKAGNSSAAVGEATTKAVVASITTIIVLDSAFAVIFTVLKI